MDAITQPELPRVTHRCISRRRRRGREAGNFKRLCKEASNFLKRNPTGKPKQLLVTLTGVLEETRAQEAQDEPRLAAAVQ
jgi:hypothetical protein